MHPTGYTVIGIKDWPRPGSVRKFFFAALIAALPPVVGLGQSLHERILADEAKDAANEIIRKERALRLRGPEGHSLVFRSATRATPFRETAILWAD